MQSEAGRIAAGLTEAQKRAIDCEDPQRVRARGHAITSLISKGLCEYRRINTFYNAFCLTPLGLEVRAILERNRNGNGN